MKNQIKLIAILSLFPMLLFGQSPFSGGINISSELSFLKIVHGENSIATSEKGKAALGYSVGAHVSYPLNEKLQLRSGLSYEQSKYRTEISGLRFGSDINNTSSTVETEMSISSIAIPLDVIYKIPTQSGNSNFLLGFGGILNVNLDTESNAKTLYGNGNKESLQETKYDVSPSVFSLLFFTGFEIELKNNKRLSIEPHVKYTPHEFTLKVFGSEASSVIEGGLTVRFDLF